MRIVFEDLESFKFFALLRCYQRWYLPRCGFFKENQGEKWKNCLFTWNSLYFICFILFFISSPFVINVMKNSISENRYLFYWKKLCLFHLDLPFKLIISFFKSWTLNNNINKYKTSPICFQSWQHILSKSFLFLSRL